MNYFSKQNSQKVGKVIVAHNPDSNEIMIIVQQDGAQGYSLDTYRNYLLKKGFTNALSFDGSNSALLIKDKNILIKNHISKDKNTNSGITFSVPIKK